MQELTEPRVGPLREGLHPLLRPGQRMLVVASVLVQLRDLQVGMNAGEVAGLHGDEGLDVNDRQDWVVAELMVESGEATLPRVSKPPYRPQPASG